jgi:hypothetical protein
MKHTEGIQYIVLTCILLGGLGAFFYVRPNELLQFVVGVATSVAYVVWGILHHMMKKDLHMRVVIEYILMGAIAIVLLATMIQT